MKTEYQYHTNLSSPRLQTRFVTESDIPAWTEFFENEEAIQFFTSLKEYPSPEEKARFWIEKQIKRYETKTYGLQAILDKTTNTFIGQCGLLLQEVDGIKEIEVGYSIIPKFWGQGYAPEAAKIFFDYGFHTLGINSIISLIDVANIKSQRVAEKNGLRIDKRTSWMGIDAYVYRIEKSDWK